MTTMLPQLVLQRYHMQQTSN